MYKLFVLLSVVLLVVARVVAKQRTLVVLENALTKDKHSLFLSDIAAKNQDIVYKYASDSSLNIKKYGEALYDHIILLCPSVTAFGNGITNANFVDFVDNGGNLVIVASSDVGEPIRELAAEVGIEIDDEGTAVIDHMNFDVSDAGYHNLIVSKDFAAPSVITGKNPQPVLFRGVGMAADPDNNLVIDILHGSTTAYSHAVDKDILDYPLAIGQNLLLVGGMQARNNARVLIFGSSDMLSDEFYGKLVSQHGSNPTPSGNRDFVSNVISWAFKHTGDLRYKAVTHNKVGEAPSDAAYRITDDVEYSITIEEAVNGQWQPFDAKDIQLEFVRIDPFVRVNLKPNAAGKFHVHFKVPDVYGVFQFKVDYDRVGYSHLYSTTQVSVRPFRHTEYERFIPSAYPYYASAFSMMGGLVVFSFVYLYHKDTTKSEKVE